MPKTTAEIIAMLGGPTAASRFFNVRPPSVMGWIDKGEIPDGRLIRKAAELEALKPGEFSRLEQWPHDYAVIWPELSTGDQAEAAAPLPPLVMGEAPAWDGVDRRDFLDPAALPADLERRQPGVEAAGQGV